MKGHTFADALLQAASNAAIHTANFETLLRYALADIADLKEALKPLADFADVYVSTKPERIYLCMGPSGKELTLADAIRARDAIRKASI